MEGEEKGRRERVERPRLTVGTEWVEVEVLSEPHVIVTFKGYAPAVTAQAAGGAAEVPLFIGSKSMTDGIEPLRQKNGGRFAGLKLRLKKESADRYARYVVEAAG